MINIVQFGQTIFIVSLMSASFFPAQVLAQEVIEFDYRAECTTEATGGDGVRHSCRSEWSTHTVPSGYVYIENKLEKGTTSDAGSENYCEHEFSDLVEVVSGTGITQPRTLKVRAVARSPKGHFTGRGWSKCYFRGVYVKYN